MRTTRRLAVAIVLTSAAVFASAQQSGVPPADSRVIIGEWLLAGILLVALFGAINLSRHRRTRPPSTAVDIPVPRPENRPV